MIAWNSRRYLNNQYLLFIGIAYLCVESLDLMHTLVCKGMHILTGNSANTPTQLWISARNLESLTLLCAPLMFRRHFRPGIILLGYGIVTSCLLLSIFPWNLFPDCFREDAIGLTSFKKISEYIICLILLASAVLIVRNREHFDTAVLRWMLASILMIILSELALSAYASVYGFANMLGHYFKIVSFYCIYRAIIDTGLAKPYELLFRDLKKSEGLYHSLFTHMISGFAAHQMVYDLDGKPVDYRFLEVNSAFEELTGLVDVVGIRAFDIIPDIQADPETIRFLRQLILGPVVLP